MKINKIVLLVLTFILISTLSITVQDSQINRFSFSSGFGISLMNDIKVTNSLGQSFVGKTAGNNSIVISRALAYSDLSNVSALRDKKSSLPDAFDLKQNYPNPFNPSTKIEYDIPRNSFVVIKVYDITGKELNVLVNKEQEAGKYLTEWTPEGMGSGIYFYRITTLPGGRDNESFSFSRKMIYLK